MNSEELVALLSPEGLLAQKFPHFKTRISQVKMLEKILEAYNQDKMALIEAATGTGKSIAYLLPALYWAIKTGERTVISTGTIALQEQLLQKDLPALLEALQLKIRVSLAKGMGNYLCLRKLEDEKSFLTQTEIADLENSAPVASATWEKVAAESESCTHMRCPHYKKCHFFKAREEAKEAELIIANHHLLLADLKMRHENDTGLLPDFTRLIVDEAHHLEEVAKEYFAARVSRNGIFRQLNRLLNEKSGGKLKALYQKLNEQNGAKIKGLLTPLELDFVVEKREIMQKTEKFFASVLHFINGAEKLRFRKYHQTLPEWGEIQHLSIDLLERAKRFTTSLFNYTNLVLEQKLCEGIIADIKGIILKLESAFLTLSEFVFSPEKEEEVKWIEGNEKNVHLVRGTIDCAHLIKEVLFDKMKTVVLTSATLATNTSFRFVKGVLGIQEVSCIEEIYSSPFDYENKTLFCVPTDLAGPDDENFLDQASEVIFETIKASKGNAFVLFTSYETLRSAERRLSSRFEQLNFPLLCQGQMSSSSILSKFCSQEHSVLFGTDSFWEGVDVVGDHLRCVIIQKIPFLVPTDPFFQAKSEWMRKSGLSPFFDYSLPQAAMKFKQGYGRLIRSENDRGCIVCLDSRLTSKGYGKVILNTLPNSKRVFESQSKMQEKIKEFFQSWK